MYHTQIVDVFVGSTRNSLLDRADPDLSLSPVVIQFGQFLKLIVTLKDAGEEETAQVDETRPSAFDSRRKLSLSLLVCSTSRMWT